MPTERLTRTQRIILDAAASSPTGSVGFGEGDRRGTRVSGYDDLGRPWVIAYQSPEYFMVARGLLERTNERHVYQITEKARAAVHLQEPRHAD